MTEAQEVTPSSPLQGEGNDEERGGGGEWGRKIKTLPNLPLSPQAAKGAATNTYYFEIGGEGLRFTDVRAKGRPDDVTYEKNRAFWAEVPRGCCYIHDTEGRLLHGVVGLPKFGYEEDLKYYQANIPLPEDSKEQTLVFTEKANGEVFHISSFRLPSSGTPVWVFGSKNVHIPILTPEELELPVVANNERYSFAVRMAKAFFKLVLEEQRHLIQQYSLATGHTLSAEHCDPLTEHLVHYKELEFTFLGINSPHAIDQLGILTVPVLQSFQLFESWGLKIPEYQIVSGEPGQDGFELSKRASEEYFEQKENSEGAVVYIHDGRGAVCRAMYKHKNHQYIILRALREQMRGGATAGGVRQRMAKLHVPVSAEEVDDLLAFYAWATAKYQNKKWSDLFDCFITEYRLFKSSPDAVMTVEEVDKALGQNRKLVIMLVAIPGAGKTTFGEALAQAMGPQAVYVDQDQFNGGGVRPYTKAVSSLLRTTGIKVVITGKCHTASKIRKVTIDATEGVMCDRVAIVFRGLDPEQTIARIKERGEAHKTLQYRPDDPGSEAKMRGVVMGFSRTFEEIQGEELENYRLVMDLDVSPVEGEAKEQSIARLVQYTMNYLAEQGVMVPLCMDEEALPRPLPSLPMYCSIEYPTSAFDDTLQEYCRSHAEEKFLRFDGRHTTLVFLGGTGAEIVLQNFPKKQEIFDWCKEHQGEEYEVTLLSLEYNDRVMAFRVVVPDGVPWENQHPHITMALAPTIAPVESSSMLASPDRTVVPLPLDIKRTLKGQVKLHYPTWGVSYNYLGGESPPH